MKPGGKIEIGGLVEGRTTPGESKLFTQEQLEAGAATANDALNRQNIPRDYKKHYKEYMEQVRGEKFGGEKPAGEKSEK